MRKNGKRTLVITILASLLVSMGTVTPVLAMENKDSQNSASTNLSTELIPQTIKGIGEGSMIRGDGFTFEPSNGILTIKNDTGMKKWNKSDIEKHTEIKSIIVEDDVTTIPYGIFETCNNLKNVEIGKNVETIMEDAFGWCKNLEKVTGGQNVKSIGEKAFYRCKNLKEIPTFDSLVTIENEAFYECISLKKIKISSKVQNIGNSALAGCTLLSSIQVDLENSNFVSENNILFDKDKKTIYLYAPGKKDSNYAIPNSIETIKERAFSSCNYLNSLTVSGQVENFEEYAFTDCENLKSVTLEDGITELGTAMFYGCHNLTSVQMPDTITTIGEMAFLACGVTEIAIPDSVISIKPYAFIDTKLKDITIGNHVQTIGEKAFSRCNDLERVIIPDSVQEIGSEAFEGCMELSRAIFINNAAPKLGYDVFKKCDSDFTVYYPSNGTGYKEYYDDYGYPIQVIPSTDDVTLSQLSVSRESLRPTFSPDTDTYTVSVSNNKNRIEIGATTSHPLASIKGDVGIQSLREGENTFVVTVYFENGSSAKKDYTIKVIRASASKPSTSTGSSSGGSTHKSSSSKNKGDKNQSDTVNNTPNNPVQPNQTIDKSVSGKSRIDTKSYQMTSGEPYQFMASSTQAGVTYTAVVRNPNVAQVTLTNAAYVNKAGQAGVLFKIQGLAMGETVIDITGSDGSKMELPVTVRTGNLKLDTVAKRDVKQGQIYQFLVKEPKFGTVYTPIASDISKISVRALGDDPKGRGKLYEVKGLALGSSWVTVRGNDGTSSSFLVDVK